MRHKSMWRWYINTVIDFLEIIHLPVSYLRRTLRRLDSFSVLDPLDIGISSIDWVELSRLRQNSVSEASFLNKKQDDKYYRIINNVSFVDVTPPEAPPMFPSLFSQISVEICCSSGDLFLSLKHTCTYRCTTTHTHARALYSETYYARYPNGNWVCVDIAEEVPACLSCSSPRSFCRYQVYLYA
jgi:hypothetical protein